MTAQGLQTGIEILIAACGIIVAIANSNNRLLVILGIVMAGSALASHICAQRALKNKEREIIAKEKKENEEKKHRYYTNIFNELKPLLHMQIDLFTQIFKATLDKKPSQICQDISKFFDVNFYSTINRLDYLQKAPIRYVKDNKDIEVNWAEYIEREYLKFKTKLENAKNILHAANLKDDIVLKLIELILTHGNNYEYGATMDRSEEIRKRGDSMTVFFLRNTFWSNKTWLEVYIEQVVMLAETHNLFSDNQIRINLHVWEENCSPKLGSSIRKKEYYRVEEKNGNKYLKKVSERKG